MVVEPVSVTAVGYFLPIFAFLLVFIVIYALLKKTKVLGGSEPVMLFISFILAAFFIVETSAVEFVEFSSSWFTVIVIAVFFILAILSFMPWKEPLGFLQKSDWFSWASLGVIVILFIVSAAYTFNFVINWNTVSDWFTSDWVGFILLLVVAGVVSVVLKSKS